jgi:hypothetical protein
MTVGRIVARGKGRAAQLRALPKRHWSKEKQETFLAHLAATCNVSASLRKVGMSSTGLYQFRRRSAEFRAGWDRALAEGYDNLELAMLKRALSGTLKPILNRNGVKIGTVREFSDSVALRLLTIRHATVRGGAGEPAEDDEAIRLRIEAKLSLMNERMGGDG